MKLYYFPGACSLSPHIVLCETGLGFDLEKVDLGTKRTESGSDYLAVNPKGYVPTLQLDDGQTLTEGPAIIQYLADRVAEKKLAPAAGTMARYRLQEWLNFISTELHKACSPLFNPNLPDAMKSAAMEQLTKRLAFTAGQLEGKIFLMGDQFTVADAYLFTVLSWTAHLHIDLAAWPALQSYQGRVAARPSVQAALKAEGLVK